MTGNGHIELFKVTSYNFHPQDHAHAPILSCKPVYHILPYLKIPLFVVISNRTAFILNFPLQVEIFEDCLFLPYPPSYTATADCIWPIKIRSCTASTCQIDSVLWGMWTTGSTVCRRRGHSTIWVWSTVPYVHISCNDYELWRSIYLKTHSCHT